MQIHLIRHGEVANPRDVVYADIPGYGLSPRGRQQAKAAGEYLSGFSLRSIVTSPLDRALETAELIAAATGAAIVTDARLTEWRLSARWRGAVWSALPVVYPGELEAYLEDPFHLPFSPESLDQVADRVTTAVTDRCRADTGDIAFVSHQDPIHIAHLRLVAAQPQVFHQRKPNHCTVTSLQGSGDDWLEVSRWNPEQ